MDTILQTTLPYILLYKYWALFGITFFTALVLPIPPGTLIMALSAFAYEGYFNFGYILIAAIAGNILGDNVGYYIARRYGASILSRIGFGKVLTSPRYKMIERAIKKRPGLIIFLSRFEVFTNLAVNIIAGMSKVRYRKYLLYESLGEICQVTLYSTIGYVFANRWQSVNSLVGKIMFALVILTILILFLFWKKGRKQTLEQDVLLQ